MLREVKIMMSIQITSEELAILEKALYRYAESEQLFELPKDDRGNYYDIDFDNKFSFDTFAIKEAMLVDSIIMKIYHTN